MNASRAAVAILAALAAAPALAQSAKEAVGGYAALDIDRTRCRTVLRSGELKASLGQGTAADGYAEFVRCQLGVESEAQKVYKSAASRMKKPAAKAALKEYQAAFLTALSANDPKGASQTEHRRRLDELEDRLQRAWQRLQLEL